MLIDITWKHEGVTFLKQTETICTLLKKGNKLECENYREISLLNVVYKISTDTVVQHIKVYTDEILGEYEDGFRKGFSTTKSYIYN
jgi:sorting nexin-29